MKTITLEKTDLQVSPICLGTVNFGTSLKEEDALKQLDRYAEVGNLIDTAHVYGDWEPPIRGRSERVIGKWLRASGLRDRMVISTKGAHPRLETMHIGRVTPEDIALDLSESLDCLQTDRVELYFLHRDDPQVPVGEILDALEEHKRAGRIRHYACSNWTLPRIIEAATYAEKAGYDGFVCNQLMWSLARINPDGVSDKTMVLMDQATYDYHSRTRLNAMAYTSIAHGFFSRLEQNKPLRPFMLTRYQGERNDRIFEGLLRLSKAYGYSVMELCFFYFQAHPFAAVALASCSAMEQMDDMIRALRADPPEELLQAILAL